MSDDFVNRVTIDCLMNKEQYNKYITSKEIKSTNRKDKKFYRQRIYSLIKELLLSKEEKNHILPKGKVRKFQKNFLHKHQKHTIQII